jgi:hypothetical protein
MLPVSMDIPFFICPVSCVPYFASFFRLNTQENQMLENTEGLIKEDNPEKLAT